jgi:hypothetical protein
LLFLSAIEFLSYSVRISGANSFLGGALPARLCAGVSRVGFGVSPKRTFVQMWGATELGRLDCRKDFPYGKEWNGKGYATKQVRPVFVEEGGQIVVITVYTYYF